MSKKKTKEGVITVQGEWFPEQSPAVSKWTKPGELPLDTEMRLFCSSMRWSFNRLLEGGARNKLKKEGQNLFGLNSRYIDDSILKAKAIIESQKELLALEKEETEKKLVKAQKKLTYAHKSSEKAINEKNDTKAKKARLAISGRKMRVAKLKSKLNEVVAHIEKGTIPKVIFGGRKFWKQKCKGRITKQTWQEARRNKLYCRGDESKGGNPNFKVDHLNGEFVMTVSISHLAEVGKVSKTGVQHMKPAPRVSGKLWLPSKHHLLIWDLIFRGQAYTVEVVKKDGQYRVSISFSLEQATLVTSEKNGYLGVDTNPNGLALANVNYLGQPESWPKGFEAQYPKALHKFEGEFQIITYPNGFMYIKVPELEYSRGDRRSYLIGVLTSVVVEIAKSLQKPLAIENLKFGKDRMGTNSRFNRMASNFPFSKIVEALIRRAYKEGVGVKQVFPAHTSTIGHFKYMDKFAVPIHNAAAYVIARRALGCKELISKDLFQRKRELRATLKILSFPMEGKRMKQKVKRLFNALDKQLPFYNGLDRFQQQGLQSVWKMLKEMVLLVRGLRLAGIGNNR